MILFFIASSLLFFFFFRIIRSSKKQQLPLPPGPYPWPIVGNLFQMGKNAHIRLAEMAQAHGPLMSLRFGQLILIVGSSPNVASEILKSHDHALSGRDVTRSLQGKESTLHNKSLAFTSESGEEWRKIRNIYTSNLFSSKAIASRAYLREKKVMEMVKYICSKGGANISIKDVMVVTATNILSNTTLSMDLLDFEGNGIGVGIQDTVRRLALLRTQPHLADFYPIFSGWSLKGWKKKVIQVVEQDFGAIWGDIIERKRNRSHISGDLKDFTDIMIERGYTHQQINALMEELFSAGIDSLVVTTEWFVAELLKNPQVMKKARDEVTKTIDDGNVVKESDLVRLPFLEACFKETLRLHPPAPLLLPHRATQTCEVMGYTIPKDSQIMVNVWAISRDPKIWNDPMIFKPERFMESKLSYKGKDFEYLPFGAGRRMCPGEPMASKTILVVVASLILNFDWFLVNNMNGEDMNMDEVLDLPTYKKEPLHLTLKLRQPSKTC